MSSAPRPTITPFLRLNARTGWPLGPEASRRGIPYVDRPLALAIEGQSPIPIAERFGSFGGRTLPRGLAISGEGRIFLTATDRNEILTARVDAGKAEKPEDAPESWPFAPLWPARAVKKEPAPDDLGDPGVPPDPYTLVGPTDVAIARNGDLVIAVPGMSRVLVMAFPDAGLRHVIDIEGGAPSAIAFDAAGRAYIADPGLRTVHRFDRSWRKDLTFPDPSVTFAAPEHVAAVAFRAECACGYDGACGCDSGRACGPAPAPEPVIMVLDKNALRAFDALGREVAAERYDPFDLTPQALVRRSDGVLEYSDPDRPGHDPIEIPGLTLTRDGRHAGSNLPIIALPRRIEVPRFGSLTTEELDGGGSGFVWDRIGFTVSLPRNTRLLVATTTSDSLIAFDRVLALPPERWSRPLALEPGDVPEILIQSPPGRYLWLRVELSGDGKTTPSISEIDIYGPRRSAMRYLPASFHQDPESVHFLDRFLSYFDTVFDEITAVNGEIARLFDPKTVPAEGFLAWLGAWFDLEFPATWSEATRRTAIAEAVHYYKIRGSVDGLRHILQRHTGLSDPLPQIIEHFRLPSGGGPVMIGGRVLDPDSPAHGFTIVMPEHLVRDEDARRSLKRLIEANIPAHTRYELRLIRPGVTVGTQSTVGVDMLLGSLGEAGLGGAILGETFSTGRVAPDGAVAMRTETNHGGLSC